MEWIIGFIVVSAIISSLTGSSKNTKSNKPCANSSSARPARAQPQVQTDNSSAETKPELEQKRRQLAEAKAALWLNHQQKEIEDALPTNDMRKRFNETKAKYFPGSQPIPLLPESQDSGSATKSSALADADLTITEPLSSSFKISETRLKSPHDPEGDSIATVKKSSVIRNTAKFLADPLVPAPSNNAGAAGSPVSIIHCNFQVAEARKGLRADGPEEARSLKNAVNELNIRKLYHFTRTSNLGSIAEHGLLSVADLRKGGINHVKNDKYRHDKRLHGISTSISFPNSRMFYRYRREARLQRWAILELNPSVLYELDCLFCRHNAADRRIANIAERDLRGVHALNSMFQEEEGLLRPAYLRKYDPIDEQAEVLVLERIDLRYVTGVVLEDQDSYESAAAALDGSLPLRFSTTDTALFNARGYVRRSPLEVSPPTSHKPNIRSDFLSYDGEIPF